MSTVTRELFEVITGLSPGRLQRWCESGLLQPVVRSHRRHFTQPDALTALLMLAFTRRGVSPAVSTPAVRQATKEILASGWWAKRPTANVAPDDLIVIVYPRGGWGRPTVVVVRRDGALAEIRKHNGPGHLLDVAEITAAIRRNRRYFRD